MSETMAKAKFDELMQKQSVPDFGQHWHKIKRKAAEGNKWCMEIVRAISVMVGRDKYWSQD